MDETPQAGKNDRPATLAFRVTSDAKHLVKAAAARRDVLPSDYLRTVLWTALEDEFGTLTATSAGEAEDLLDGRDE